MAASRLPAAGGLVLSELRRFAALEAVQARPTTGRTPHLDQRSPTLHPAPALPHLAAKTCADQPRAGTQDVSRGCILSGILSGVTTLILDHSHHATSWHLRLEAGNLPVAASPGEVFASAC